MGDGSYLWNLSVIRTASDANDLYGVKGGTTHKSYLYNCRISVTQSGAGDAYAVGAVNGAATAGDGSIDVVECELAATASGGGVGYCGRSTFGLLHVWAGKADTFTTGRFTES